MGETRQAGKRGTDFVVGASLLIGLTVFFGIELTIILTRQRPFHRFWVVCLLASAVADGCLAGKFSPRIGKKIRLGVFVLIVAASTAFIHYGRLPITAVSMTLRSVAGPTDFLLRQFLPDRRNRFKMVHRAPSRHAVTFTFSLPAVMRGHRRAFEIYFGRAPKSYDIMKVCYGTRVLGWSIPLATYRGANILQIAGTPKTINRFTLIGDVARLASKKHVRPTLHILSNEDVIRRDIPRNRVFAVKLLWFFMCAGGAWLIIWHRKMSWLKIPRKEALIAYLTR